jgi:hypothetical protein
MARREGSHELRGLEAARKGKRAAAAGQRIVSDARRALMRTWKPILSTARANDNRKGGHLRVMP